MGRAVLYLGPCRTGSGSVVRALRSRAESLAAKGVDVAPDDVSSHSWMVAERWPFVSRSPEASLVASAYPDDTDWDAAWASDRRRASCSNHGTVVLASPYFHLVADPATTFDALAGFARTAVCCVREQTKVASSSVAAMASDPSISYEHAVSKALAFDLDYAAVEARWTSAGFDVVFVAHSVDVVPDVLSAMGLGRTSGPAPRVAAAPSEAVAYLYERKESFGDDASWPLVCSSFLEAVRHVARRFSDRPLLPPWATTRLRKRTDSSNAVVASRHPHVRLALARPDFDRPYAGMQAATRALCDFLFVEAVSESKAEAARTSVVEAFA